MKIIVRKKIAVEKCSNCDKYGNINSRLDSCCCEYAQYIKKSSFKVFIEACAGYEEAKKSEVKVYEFYS